MEPSYRLSQTMDRSALIGDHPRITEPVRRELEKQLRSALGESSVISDRDQLVAYSYDATGERHWPDVVVLPGSREEVCVAVRIARQLRAPIIGRGAATNLSGGTTPLVGGMIVGFSRMNRILDIDVNNRTVRVEAGVVNADLQDALKPLGFFYPPDPSSHRISTLGGNIAENSGGPHCVKYGVTTHHVLSLEVVLSDGSTTELPRVGDTTRGVDLASLVVGSEGTLALVTAATLSIHPLPPTTKTLLVSFRSVDDALRTVSAIVAARIMPSTLELMDEKSLAIVESYVHAGYPTGAGSVLLIEVDGSQETVDRSAGEIRLIAQKQGALNTQIAASPEEADALWRGRRAHYGASARLAPHLWVQDVTVPRPLLGTMMDRVLAIADRHRLLIVTAAHAGDGNLHPTMPYDPEDLDQVARLKAADHEILTQCVELGGAITGEHGIGIDKAEHLPLMYTPEELSVMTELKTAFDPGNALNPFKAIWQPEPVKPERGAGDAHLNPTTTRHVQEVIEWAQMRGRTLMVRGQGRRSAPDSIPVNVVDMRGMDQLCDLDIDNLSVEVESGMIAGNLSRLLAQEGLELPGVEPFMDDTVGGLVASNAPYWRNSLGRGWRDVLLAVQWVDGQGRLLRFGRKTMKNVAGYDVSKLAVGSRGQFGVITKLTLKVRSRPAFLGYAESSPLSPSEAMQTAQQILKDSRRPQGVLLVRPQDTEGVRLQLVDDFSRAGLKNWLKEIVPGGLQYQEGEDAWLRSEKERLQQVYRAIALNSYDGFMADLRGTPRLWDQIPREFHVSYCPGTGWCEVLGPLAPEGAWANRTSDGVFTHLKERVRRVFDPGHLFR